MRASEVTKKDLYISQLFALETALQKKIAEAAKNDGRAINISAVEGKMLQLLATSIGAKKIVEVGTLYGYSASWFLGALPDSGTLYTIEKDSNNHKKAADFLKKLPNFHQVNLLQGDAHEKLKELEKNSPFDFIFIDADKASYPNYLDWAEKNIRKGGMIVGDNTFLFGSVYGEGSGQSPATIKKMQLFNERLADDKKYRSIIFPTAEGMTVAIKLF